MRPLGVIEAKGLRDRVQPFRKPHPPIWFGASQPAAVRRAVRLADGFFGAGSQSTAQFAGLVQTALEALAEQGRDPAGFRIAKRVYIAVDDDPDRARQRIAEGLDRLYGYFGLPGLSGVPVAGTPEDCEPQAQAFGTRPELRVGSVGYAEARGQRSTLRVASMTPR